MVVVESAQLFSVVSLLLLHVRLKTGNLGCQLFFALLQLLLEPIEALTHDVFFEIGVQVIRQFIETSDSCSQ